jgi:hypothetical protein
MHPNPNMEAFQSSLPNLRYCIGSTLEEIILMAALGIFFLKAHVTGLATADRFAADLKELGLPTRGDERFQDFFQEDFHVPALARASIDGDGFHAANPSSDWAHISCSLEGVVNRKRGEDQPPNHAKHPPPPSYGAASANHANHAKGI